MQIETTCTTVKSTFDINRLVGVCAGAKDTASRKNLY